MSLKKISITNIMGVFLYTFIALYVYIVNMSLAEYLIIYFISYFIMLFFFYRKLRSLKRIITSIEFLYISAYSIYAIMPAIQYVIDDGKQRLEFFSITQAGVSISTKWYLMIFLNIIIVLFLFNYPMDKKYELRIKKEIRNTQSRKVNGVFDIVAGICVMIFIYSFLKNGLSFFALDFVYRRSTSDFAIRQYIWLYMMVYSVEIICECSFNKDILKNKRRIIQLGIIFVFWSASLLVDRRHFVPVIVAVVLYMIFMNKKISKTLIIFIILFVLSMILYAVVRSEIQVGTVDINTLIYNAFAEFILTGYITVFYAMHPVNSFYMGRTYIWDTITRVFPKSIFPWKPTDLAEIFMKSVLQNRVGFAFNPVAEGYLNFGGYLIWFVPIIFLIFIKIGYRLTNKEPLFYFMFCSYFLDFSRGQFANCIFDIVVMYIILYAMKNVRIKNG